MIIKMLIVAPIARSLQGGLSGLFGGSTLNATPWDFPKFAGGTDFAPGGLALVGEKGPELVNLPRGAQVIPNNVAMGGGGPVTIGGTSITVNGNMDDAAMSQVQMILRQHQRAIASIGKTIRGAQHEQATGVGY
jgi:hypothetical protein